MLWPRGTFLVLLSYISQDSWLEANEMNSGYFKHNEQFLGGCRSLRSQWGSRGPSLGKQEKPNTPHDPEVTGREEGERASGKKELKNS